MDDINQHSARAEALRRVVERVTAWQETATEGTIHEELDKGLREANLTLTPDQRELVAQQIAAGRGVEVDALSIEGEGDGPA